MRRKPPRGAGFWNSSGYRAPGTLAPCGRLSNLWKRRLPPGSPHHCSPAGRPCGVMGRIMQEVLGSGIKLVEGSRHTPSSALRAPSPARGEGDRAESSQSIPFPQGEKRWARESSVDTFSPCGRRWRAASDEGVCRERASEEPSGMPEGDVAEATGLCGLTRRAKCGRFPFPPYARQRRAGFRPAIP